MRIHSVAECQYFIWVVSFRLRCFYLNNSWLELWKQHNSHGFYLLTNSRHHLLLAHPITKYFQFSRRSLSSWRTRRDIKWVTRGRMFECQTDSDTSVRYNNMTWISMKCYLCMNISVDQSIVLYMWVPSSFSSRNYCLPDFTNQFLFEDVPCPSPSYPVPRVN